MITKHYCKKCFKTVVDDTAQDKYLFMSSDDMICESCGRKGAVVARYFKWCEHTVTPDGKHIEGASRHVGVNPNYSHFTFSYPYADVENFHS